MLSLTCAELMMAGPLRTLLGAIPGVVFIGLIALVASFREAGPGRLRDSMLIAGVIGGVWVIAGTEVLSLFTAVSFGPVLTLWCAAGMMIAAILWRRRERLRGLLAIPESRPWGIWAPMVVTIAMIALAGFVAVVAPPNTLDALLYHMPRQIYWIQQQSVDHYASDMAQQLAMPPLAEFTGMHMMILSAGDYFANLVQWTALVLAAVAGSLLARELGAKALGQWMAALLVVSNPMAWLQATSAKNDLLTALWVLVLAVWLIRIVRDGQCGPGRWLLVGAVSGLAAMTKFTGVMFAMPLLVAVGLWMLIRRRWSCFPLAATVLVVAVVLNAGHLSRNMAYYGSPHAAGEMQWRQRPHTNETRMPGAMASNLVRNLALHMGTPWEAWNRELERTIRRGHAALGLDPDDLRLSAYSDFAVLYRPVSEEHAGAPVHLALLIGAFGVLAVLRRREEDEPVRTARDIHRPEAMRIGLVLAAAVAGFVLFCVLLKWQPWHARLHLGLVALVAAPTAAILCRGRGIGAIVVTAVLAVMLAPSVLWNQPRPLLGDRSILTMPRDQLLFLGRAPMNSAGFEETVAFVKAVEPRVVGMRMRWQGEYPMQRRLLRELDPQPFFTHPITPRPQQELRPWPSPDVLITNIGTWSRIMDRGHGQVLHRVHAAGRFSVLVQEEVARQLHEDGVIDSLPDFTGPRH